MRLKSESNAEDKFLCVMCCGHIVLSSFYYIHFFHFFVLDIFVSIYPVGFSLILFSMNIFSKEISFSFFCGFVLGAARHLVINGHLWNLWKWNLQFLVHG